MKVNFSDLVVTINFKGRLLDSHVNIEVKIADKIVGWAAFSPSCIAGYTHYVAAVEVRKQYRRQGIALYMYLLAENKLGLRLNAGDTNEKSQALWEKLRKLKP